MRLIRSLLLNTPLLVAMAACWPDILPPGGGGDVGSVVVSPRSSTLLVGDNQQLTARVVDRAGNEVTDLPITWQSSDPAAVDVSDGGMVSALTVTDEPVTIEATSGGVTGTATITVTAAPPVSLEIRPRGMTVPVGSTLQLEAEVRDARGEVVPVSSISWTGSNAHVAEVATDGRVRGVSLGALTVYAALGSLRDSIPVEVVAPTRVSVCSAELGNGLTVHTLASALETVSPGGEILLCEGTFQAPALDVEHPVTIRSIPGDRATIQGRLNLIHAQGSVNLRNLTFAVDDSAGGLYAVRANGLSDVRVEGSAFLGIGMAFGEGQTTGTLTVQDSRFLGGGNGGVAIFGGEATVVDNYFEGQTGLSSLQWQGGTSGEVLRNRFLECGFRGCIRVVNAGTVLIADNFIETHERLDVFGDRFGGGVVIGIAADGVDVTAEGNTIIGMGPVEDPTNRDRYPMSMGALYTLRDDPGRRTILRNNVVRGAGVGIGGHRVETLIARDNLIEEVHTVISVEAGPNNQQGAFEVQGNDFTSYVVPFGIAPLPPASLTCNWWGVPTGPAGSVTVEPSQFTPFATSPIAGTGRAC